MIFEVPYSEEEQGVGGDYYWDHGREEFDTIEEAAKWITDHQGKPGLRIDGIVYMVQRDDLSLDLTSKLERLLLEHRERKEQEARAAAEAKEVASIKGKIASRRRQLDEIRRDLTPEAITRREAEIAEYENQLEVVP